MKKYTVKLNSNGRLRWTLCSFLLIFLLAPSLELSAQRLLADYQQAQIVPQNCPKKCYAVVAGYPDQVPIYQGDFAIGYLILPFNAKCECTVGPPDSCKFLVQYKLYVDDGNGYREVKTALTPTDSLIFAQWHGVGLHWTGCQATTNTNFSQWGDWYVLPCNSWKYVSMHLQSGGLVSPTPFSNRMAIMDTVDLEIQFALRCTPCIDKITPPCSMVEGDDDQGQLEEPSEKSTGNAPPQKELDYELYPNPGKGVFHLDFFMERPSDEVLLIVTDMSGNTITWAAWNVLSPGKNTMELDLGELGAGNYLYYLQVEGEQLPAKRLVVVR